MEKEYYKTIYDIAKKYETENAFLMVEVWKKL